MINEKDFLRFYNVEQPLYEYFKSHDHRVANNKEDKHTRPYIGILFEINKNLYIAPLYSPKPKHKNLINTIDLEKIENGNYGVINFNNMIPVKEKYIKEVSFEIFENDDIKTKKYKNILLHQYSWCNEKETRKALRNKATKLYNLYPKLKEGNSLKRRCCDFLLLENKLKIYDNYNILFNALLPYYQNQNEFIEKLGKYVKENGIEKGLKKLEEKCLQLNVEIPKEINQVDTYK